MPTEADEGSQLQVLVAFNDSLGNPETSWVSAGTVQESPSETLSVVINGSPVEGAVITATVTDTDMVGGDLPATGITYKWYAGGTLVHTAGDDNSYTPTEAVEGKALTVTASFTDAAGNPESGTSAASAAVAENPTENASISLSGAAIEGTPITATVTELDAPASGILYTWTVNGETVHTGTDADGATYTPTEADEGTALQVSVSFTDKYGNHEIGNLAAGTVAESPTEHATIALNGLNGAGNAVQDRQITATVTDADAPLSGITYTWTVGGKIVLTGTDAAGATYTPTEADEGKTISVAVSFTDTHGFAETGTTSAGTVQESPTEHASISLATTFQASTTNDLVATLDATTAQQGTAIHVTGVTDGGNPLSTGLSYAWMVSSDNGQHWTAVGSNASYTPLETDEGKLLQLVVSFAGDSSGSESSTYSLGTVQESAANDLVATLDSMTAKQGVAIHVTGVTDGGITVSTGLSYAWQVSSDNGQHWATVGHSNSYTPAEADEGKVMQLIVTYADASGSESSTYSLGMANDLVATLDSTTATQGVAIHVTSVKDGGTAKSTGLSYAWQVSSDNGQHWITVGTNSGYTPAVADEGKTLQLIVTYADAAGNESATDFLGTVMAPVKDWKGGSHDWQVGGQWTPSGVPGSGDDAVIDASGAYTVTIDQNAVAHSLTVNGAGAKVEIVGGNTLTIGANLTITCR